MAEVESDFTDDRAQYDGYTSRSLYLSPTESTPVDPAVIAERERKVHRANVVLATVGIAWTVLSAASLIGALITSFTPAGTAMPFVYAFFVLIALGLIPLGLTVAYVLDGGA